MPQKKRSGLVQQDLLSECDSPVEPEPILQSLNPLYYALIWEGTKHYEYRRRFLKGPAQWFVYLTQPASSLGAVIDLGTPIIDTPQRIADIAEQSWVGNGASVFEYTQDLACAYAIPILRVREFPALHLTQLRERLGRFTPPQGYLRICHNASLLDLCREWAAQEPVRVMDLISPVPPVSVSIPPCMRR